MKKYIFGVTLLLAVCVSPVLVQAQSGLTSGQISAILGLLQAFGADQSVINNVKVALNGGSNTIVTPPTPFSNCQNRWWFDSTHPTCSSQQFCGAYMYYGLQTFESQSACQMALPVATTTTVTAITTTALSGGVVGISYNAAIAGTGGGNSYNWQASGLPPGLSFLVPNVSCTSGQASCFSQLSSAIYGTPTTAGTYTVTIALTSGGQTVSKKFNLIVSAR